MTAGQPGVKPCLRPVQNRRGNGVLLGLVPIPKRGHVDVQNARGATVRILSADLDPPHASTENGVCRPWTGAS